MLRSLAYRLSMLSLVCATLLTSGVGASEGLLQAHDRVVFIGNTFADQLRLHGYLETTLSVERPDLKLTFCSLGWSGDTVSKQPRPLNFGSLDEHLTRQQADVIVACFGMAESLDDATATEAFSKRLATIVEHFKSNRYNGRTAPRVVLVTPIARETSRFGDAAEHNQSLGDYSAAILRLAKELKLASVDLFDLTRELSAENSVPPLTRNGIHLSSYGYWAVSHAIASTLVGALPRDTITLDASSGQLQIDRGRQAHKTIRLPKKIVFTIVDMRLPRPASPKPNHSHEAPHQAQRQLIVRNLKPGTYRLVIDGKPIVAGDDRQWAAGIAFSGTPGQKLTEQLRKEIVRKNEWFFYRWRPANAEYVFGRRTKPYGNVSFPPEMKEFDRLIAERETAIHQLAEQRQTQLWQLESISP